MLYSSETLQLQQPSGAVWCHKRAALAKVEINRLTSDVISTMYMVDV